MNTFGAAPFRAVVDTGACIAAVDTSLAQLLGRDAGDLLGAALSTIVDPADLDGLGDDMVAVVEGASSLVTAPRRLRRADGTAVDAVISIQRRDLAGRFAGFDMAVLVDEDRTALAPTLPEHLRRLGVAAALVDATGQIVDTNVSWGRLFALPEAVAPGGDLYALAHDDDRDRLRDELAEFRRSNATGLRIELRCSSGLGHFWSRLSVARLDAGGDHLTVTAEDITRQRLETRILLTNEALFRSLAESSAVGIARTTADLVITYASPAWSRLTGLGDGASLVDLVRDDEQATVAATMRERAAARSNEPLHVRLATGPSPWVSIRMAPVDDAELGLIGHVATIEDVTDLVDTTVSAAHIVGAVEATSDLVLVLDAERDTIDYLNAAAAALFGAADGGRSPDDLYTAEALATRRDQVDPVLRRGATWTGELDMVRADGESVRVVQTIAAEPGPDGAPARLSVLGRDVTGERSAMDDLVFRATHDTLTGLPNRGLLQDRLDLALARMARDLSPVAVLFVDLDRFKAVNDTHGHDAGDQVLRDTAERMASVLRPSDTVARLGGDEFVVLCEDLEGELDAVAIAHRLLRVIEGRPHLVGGTSMTVSASIGVAVADPAGAADPDVLLRRADTAMYRAKQAGRSRIELFDDVLRDRNQRRTELTEQLETTVDEAALDVLYQPLVDLRSGRIVAAEALVRWRHPTHGLLEPADFLPLATAARMDDRLDRLVIGRALADRAEWRDAGATGLPPMHVNVFGRTLMTDGFARWVRDELAEHQLDGSALVLELSERFLMTAGDEVDDAMAAFADSGVRFVVDDVGAGATVLGRLACRHLSMLKIDREVVAHVGSDDGEVGRRLLGATVALGHSLGMAVAAEAVEDPATVRVLARLGADLAQGRVFSAPVDAEALSGLLPLRSQVVPTRA